MLATETDLLEEQNKEIKEQIERIIQRNGLTENEKEEYKKQRESELAALIAESENDKADTEATKRTFRKIQQHVEMMVEMFKRSRFYLSVATKMSYDEGFIFSENNIVSYLAELEEYICSLITYSAFKRDDPQAAISAIPIEKLNTKTFERKDLTVSSE